VVRPAFELVQQGRINAFASTVSIVEVLTAPLKADNQGLASTYQEFFRDTENLTVVALTRAIAESAAGLRSRYDLKTADAIVAATALDSACEALITNDSEFKRLTGLKILYVSDYV
jgi:predicted nucleic acid-binding protein